MDTEVLGIDLGKIVYSFAGLEVTGAGAFRKHLQRKLLLNF